MISVAVMHRRVRVPPTPGHRTGVIPIRDNQPTGGQPRANRGYPAQNRHRPHRRATSPSSDTDRGHHHIDHEQRHERIHHRLVDRVTHRLAPPR